MIAFAIDGHWRKPYGQEKSAYLPLQPYLSLLSLSDFWPGMRRDVGRIENADLTDRTPNRVTSSILEMDQGLLVTVILPLFNAGRFLSPMLESLYAQNYRPMQVVLWDDGSSDGTGLLAQQWAGLHTSNSFEVVFHREEENRGICASVSDACQLARGVYWAFADQDDAWEAEKVSVEAALLGADSTTSIVFCDRQLMDSNDRILCPSEYRYLGFRSETAEQKDFLHGKARFSANAMLARRSAIESCLPIPALLTSYDLYLALSAVQHGRARFIHNALVRYRIHASNLSGNYSIETSSNYTQFRLAIAKLRKTRRRLREIDARLLAEHLGYGHPLGLWPHSRIEFLPDWILYCLSKLRGRIGRFAHT